jgi:beta-glucosidase
MKKQVFIIVAGLFLSIITAAETPKADDWKWSKYGIEKTNNPDAIPVPYKAKWKIAQEKQLKGTPLHTWGIRTIMLGDSITAGWRWSGKAKKAPKILMNLVKSIKKGNIYSYAISGDETKNILWQITEGEMIDKRIKPYVFIMMIGVNNIMRRKSDESIKNTADGIKTIIKVLEKKYPKAKILLLAVLPHFGKKYTARAVKLNKLIEKFADFKKVYYLDMSEKFLEGGNHSKTLYYDGIHPNDKGYQVWADTMKPYLEDLLKNKGEGEVWKPLK